MMAARTSPPTTVSIIAVNMPKFYRQSSRNRLMLHRVLSLIAFSEGFLRSRFGERLSKLKSSTVHLGKTRIVA